MKNPNGPSIEEIDDWKDALADEAAKPKQSPPAKIFILDKYGREIMVGDTLKMYHFTDRRGKKYWMYKYVAELIKVGGVTREMPAFKISHLGVGPGSMGHFTLVLNGSRLEDMEIVQGYGMDGTPFYDRPRRFDI